MTCPVDGSELVMTERQGVEIDYCPKCRGVWLDRGELDKIIERSDAYAASPQNVAPPSSQEPRHEQSNYEQPRSGGSGLAGMLGEVLDTHGRRDDDYRRDDSRRDDYRRDKYDDDDYYRRKKKKKGGLLGELFDF